MIMGKIYAISYGDKKYSMSLKVNLISARIFGGANKLISYGPEDVDQKFRIEHQDILETPRGGGLWLWKPYIIKKTIENCLEYGDFLMYADSGTVYVNKIKHLTSVMERDNTDIFLSSSCFIERQWSKRDAFELIGVDYEKYEESFQTEATFVLFRKSKNSLSFIDNWLKFCCDRRIVSDDANTCGKDNATDFIENRHDQTVLSLLGKKCGISAYRGISDSSELYKFLQYNDNTFGIPKDILIYNAIRHHNTEEYIKGTYPRIMVNTRLQNSSICLFVYRLIKKVHYAKRLDQKKEIIESRYILTHEPTEHC